MKTNLRILQGGVSTENRNLSETHHKISGTSGATNSRLDECVFVPKSKCPIKPITRKRLPYNERLLPRIVIVVASVGVEKPCSHEMVLGSNGR